MTDQSSGKTAINALLVIFIILVAVLPFIGSGVMAFALLIALNVYIIILAIVGIPRAWPEIPLEEGEAKK